MVRSIVQHLFLAVALLAAISSDCVAQSNTGSAPTPTVTENDKDTYVLGSGDRLRIIVYGEPDLSGEFEIDANGAISLPLVGVVAASNQTIRGLERAITKKYDEYVRDPRVSLQVILYRPFFILGEVKQPGQYSFIPGMTVKNAVALAGGYTIRGGPRGISIQRATDKGKGEQPGNEDIPVYPGDTVKVTSRLF
jgi:protein involved in polysaccharide export with SLBB domain